MNPRQLEKLGVPADCMKAAIMCIQKYAKSGQKDTKGKVAEVAANPDSFVGDEYFADFAKDLIGDREFVRPAPIPYKTWGDAIVQNECHDQMRQACSLPMAVGAALMPDGHMGYGLPIGGVLALDNAVCPYSVGVDIACRMKLSILDLKPDTLTDKFNLYKEAIEKGTRFGVGAIHEVPQHHDVLDADWTVTRVTRENKDKARKQLGTSGSGNHFCEFGVFTLDKSDLGLEAGQYVALMTHSGSRGAGAAVCDTYSSIAQTKLPHKYKDLGRLAWLDMASQEGQEYWAAMNLMGEYASANHAVIHRLIAKYLGAEVVAGVENHHNFCWKEIHNGREVYVHRKGATPAGEGVLGVIPGSMADSAFVVRGKGNPESLNSASHGAGRVMSRKKAKETFNWKAVKEDLAQKGITVLSAGADEAPGVYKNILDVMAEQSDLVEIVAQFDPKIVKMSDDGKSED